VKTLLLTCAFATLMAAPALACRGTAEYPDVTVRLASANLPAGEKEALSKQLKEGEVLHDRGHARDDAALRQESLKILDEIKAKLAR
jgi:hypothetical protein